MDLDQKFSENLNAYNNSHDFDYYNWRLNPMLGFTSESSNHKVKEVYNDIIESEFSDSDYWTLHGGYIIGDKLYTFTVKDWNDLHNDLINWKFHQLYLFCEILTEEYHQGSNADNIIAQRSFTYCYILTLIVPTPNPLCWIVLLDNFEFIREGDPKPKALLKKIDLLFDQMQSISGLGSLDKGHTRFKYLREILRDVAEK